MRIYLARIETWGPELVPCDSHADRVVVLSEEEAKRLRRLQRAAARYEDFVAALWQCGVPK